MRQFNQRETKDMQFQRFANGAAECRCPVKSGLDGTRVARRSALLTQQWHTVDAARIELRRRRSSALGIRSARKLRNGAAWLALTLCVAASAAHAQTTCDPADGPCFDPFAHGSPYEGCRTPVLTQHGCLAGEPIATAGLVELAVCMANVRAGFPAPPPVSIFGELGNPDIQASAQENMFCGPGSGCAFQSSISAHMSWLIANGLTSDD